MKKTFFLAMFSVLNAHAVEVHVGDMIKYALKTEGIECTITASLSTVDRETGTATVTRTSACTGMDLKTESTEESIAQIEGAGAQILQMCGLINGTIEKVTTAAGEFEACHYKNVDTNTGVESEYFGGDVPFGLIKISGGTNSIELIEVKSGN